MSELENIKGLGPATLAKLESAGISTAMNLAVTSPAEVASVSGISETVARKLIKEARKNVQLGFEKAKDYSTKKSSHKIGTGCESFDTMLDGGFESGTLIEVYGETAAGKTQLSHLITTRALLEDKDNKAIYIDTENTFRQSRIKDFSEANGIDFDDAMDRIYVARAYNSDHQMLLIDEVERMLQQDNTYKILVVDSLTSHFRAEFIGRGTLATRQQKLNKHLHQLLKIADLYNLVVVLSNQVQSDPGQMFGNPIKPIGGNIVSHAVTSIIYMRKGKQGSRHATLVDSPSLPQNEADFMITTEGFKDV